MKKLTTVAVLLLALFAAGCQTTQPQVVITTKQSTVVVPTHMWNCPVIKQQDFPDPATLTDIEVAHLLNQLSNNNLICKASIDAIRAYLTQTKQITG